jgi:D-alanine transfer protein
MKQGFLKFFKFHFIPIIIGICFSILILYLFNIKLVAKKSSSNLVKGQQLMLRGVNSNFELGEQTEIEFCGSLMNPNCITLMGSSEFGELAFTPYYFLPDSLNTPVIGFGHAHHQSFAMFCELLAMQKYLNKSKICIILSPGWFESEGTNIEAFLEFVRPNFLKSIIRNKNISNEDKLVIGKYISDNFNLINQPNQSLIYLKNLYFSRNIPYLTSTLNTLNFDIEHVKYQVKLAKNTLPSSSNINFKTTKKRLKNQFISSITSNKKYIVDDYYINYLVDKKRGYRKGNTDVLTTSSNREYADFKLLVKFLKRNNCKVSFIIQPLNPLHYKDLDNFNETLDSVKRYITQNNFTYFDMFVSDPKKYDAGVLNDIMHLGDYGWMKINEFILKTYNIKNGTN